MPLGDRLAPRPGRAEQSSLSTTGTLLDHVGPYVVVLRLAVPAREPLTLVSLHARPVRYDGNLTADELPQPRTCEAGPWWSDVAAAGLAELTARGPVLCAGDLNECLAWDRDHAGLRCGAEFFERLEERGLVDLKIRDWPSERATRQAPAYQVDRILADAGTAGQVRVRDEAPAFDGLSDHAPLCFELNGLND
jgi:endonuclease/exonuclease/phosphatase family metal-dependent hydrolase